MRRCEDCRYHLVGMLARLKGKDCGHPELRFHDGAPAKSAHERTELGRCGPLGQLWEAKIGVTATIGIRG